MSQVPRDWYIESDLPDNFGRLPEMAAFGRWLRALFGNDLERKFGGDKAADFSGNQNAVDGRRGISSR